MGYNKFGGYIINLNDKEFKDFEKETLTLLKTIGFTPTGYFPYPYATDVSGYLKPSPPFNIPRKTMVRIAKNEPSEISVHGFQKLAIDSLANLKIIAFHEPITTISPKVKEQINNLEIEFFDRNAILRLLKESNISKANIQNYPICDMIGPPLLAQELPEVAQQKIPSSMKDTAQKLGLAPWQLFEDSVFSIFHYCFNFPTKKLGGERLFEHEPEGIVTVGDVNRFALIYECKTAKASYAMTSDHELRYKDYIKNKTKTVQSLYASTLKYFVIIAPAFSGNLGERRQKIFEETQVLFRKKCP